MFTVTWTGSTNTLRLEKQFVSAAQANRWVTGVLTHFGVDTTGMTAAQRMARVGQILWRESVEWVKYQEGLTAQKTKLQEVESDLG